MSDFNSSLPVRTQNNGDVVTQLADGTTASQLLAIDASGKITSKLDDASGNGITSTTVSSHQALDVNVVSSVSGSGDNSPATQNITAQDTASTSTSEANGQVYVTGSPTAGSAASFVLASYESVEVQITGTWTGTLSTEVSMDGGTTWIIRGIKQTGSSYLSSSFTANFEGGINVAAMTNFRVRSTATWTGTATVKVVESLNVSNLIITNPQLLRDSTTQSITNTIKAASTASVVGDTALVVAMSPNSPTPTGSNTIGAVTQASGPWSQNLTEVGGSAIALGQTTMSASVPVAIASNQSTLNSNVYVGGSTVSNTNPVPVSVVSTAPGTAIQSYNTSAALAAASSVTFTYTVAATHTFNLERVWSSASGKIKSVVQNNGSTIFVGFNSTANPNIDMTIVAPPTIAAGNAVTVTITNDDKQAFDVYATIEGNQN